MQRETWEFRFKACSAIASLVSALSIVVGGVVGIHTYKKQAQEARETKLKELRLLEYQQKREVYYELVNAASLVANSKSKLEAVENGSKYATLYFGKAHIFAIDQTVSDAKIAFFAAMVSALDKGEFPSTELRRATLELSGACKSVLQAQSIYGITDSASKPPETYSK